MGIKLVMIPHPASPRGRLRGVLMERNPDFSVRFCRIGSTRLRSDLQNADRWDAARIWNTTKNGIDRPWAHNMQLFSARRPDCLCIHARCCTGMSANSRIRRRKVCLAHLFDLRHLCHRCRWLEPRTTHRGRRV